MKAALYSIPDRVTYSSADVMALSDGQLRLLMQVEEYGRGATWTVINWSMPEHPAVLGRWLADLVRRGFLTRTEIQVQYSHGVLSKPEGRVPFAPPAELEELEDFDLAPGALRFLLLIRAECNARATDGRIDAQIIGAVRGRYDLPYTTLQRYLADLVERGHWIDLADGRFQDARFAWHLKSAEERGVESKKRSARRSKGGDPPRPTVTRNGDQSPMQVTKNGARQSPKVVTRPTQNGPLSGADSSPLHIQIRNEERDMSYKLNVFRYLDEAGDGIHESGLVQHFGADVKPLLKEMERLDIVSSDEHKFWAVNRYSEAAAAMRLQTQQEPSASFVGEILTSHTNPWS